MPRALSIPARRAARPRALTAQATQALSRAWPEFAVALASGTALTIAGGMLLPGDFAWQALPALLRDHPLLGAVLAVPLLLWAGRLLWARRRVRLIDSARRQRRRGQRRSATQAEALAPLPTPRRIAIAGLTGILDRDTFVAEAERVLGGLRRGGDAALLLFDTHAYALLEFSSDDLRARTFVQQIANRLRAFDSDRSRLAHLGRDRFAMLIDEPGDASQVQALAGQMLAAFEQPVTLFEDSIAVRPSIGISLSPRHGRTLAELLTCAETARYAATLEGRGSAVHCEAQDNGRGCHARLLTELDRALREDRLIDDYALQQSTRDGHTPRMRLMPSWPRSDGRAMAESAFINLPARVAELHAVADWLLNRALSRVARWHGQGRMGVAVAVRLPDDALARLPIARMLRRLLTVHCLSGPVLTLEIGARALAVAPSAALDQLRELRAMRIGLCLGDVGGPLATPNAAAQFPFDEIRLLPSLVGRAQREPVARRTLQSMCELAHALQLACTVPGVMSAADLSLARSLGADRVEGRAVAPLLLLPDARRPR